MSKCFETVLLRVLDRTISVHCQDAEVCSLLTAGYGAMFGEFGAADLDYTVGRQKGSGGFFLKREGERRLVAADAGQFLFFFEKEITIELQKLRPDLYFMHGGVLEFRGKALMLAGASGSGKSTTTWALLHHGFRYLSDELAPVNLTTLEVYPYPHALCLKNEPAGIYPLPPRSLRTSRTLHVPVDLLPGGVTRVPLPLTAIFFLRDHRDLSNPTIMPISRAAAAAHLMTNALNPLAHTGYGLDGAVEISTRVPSFEVFRSDLHETCALVKSAVKTVLSSAVKQRRTGSKY